MSKFSALCIYPGNGSVWLDDCYWEETPDGKYIVGEAWDDSQVGHSMLPADYPGEKVVMNFPETCVLKVVE